MPVYESTPDGGSPVSAELEKSWDKIHGPEPDTLDRALRTLTEAAKVLGDTSMMKALRVRVEEQRKALKTPPLGKRENADG